MDAKSLADGIINMLNNKQLRKYYIVSGYERAKQYDIAYAIGRIEEIFDGKEDQYRHCRN